MPADLPPNMPAAAQQLSVDVFDLSRLGHPESEPGLRVVRPRCPAAANGEIVVCAPDYGEDRSHPLADTYAQEQGLPRAKIGLGNGASLDIHVEAAAMPDGTVGRRVMAGVKVPF